MFSPQNKEEWQVQHSLINECTAPGQETPQSNNYEVKQPSGGLNVFNFSPTHSSEKKKETSEFILRNHLDEQVIISIDKESEDIEDVPEGAAEEHNIGTKDMRIPISIIN